MAKLTKKERMWFEKLQAVLDECPFDTSDFDSFTIGDPVVTVFKNKQGVAEHQIENESDLSDSVDALDAEVFELKFPFGVASAAG
jgi:hypothetical protein